MEHSSLFQLEPQEHKKFRIYKINSKKCEMKIVNLKDVIPYS